MKNIRLARNGNKNGMYGSHRTGETNPFYGRHHSDETKEKIRIAKTGKKLSEEHKAKIKANTPRGNKSPQWKGGLTNIGMMIRKTPEYRQWRVTVFERDKYTCINCGDDRGGNLEADHIKPFSQYPELRLDISNGRTLCKTCHRNIGWQFFREMNPRKCKVN